MKLKIKNKLYFVTCFLFLIGICKVISVQKEILCQVAYFATASHFAITPGYTNTSAEIFTKQIFNYSTESAVYNSNGKDDGTSTKARNNSESDEEMRWSGATGHINCTVAGGYNRNIRMPEGAQALPSVIIHQMGILRL